MAPLTYEKLDPNRSEIRLLKIHIEDVGGIQCELTKHSLNFNPKYLGLSYVWGDPNVTEEITVNGQVLAVTTNLASALEVLAKSFYGRPRSEYLFWIDAICINQGDIQERTHQVRLMGDIFKNATSVLAWLGPEEDRSAQAIALIKHMANEIRLSSRGDIDFLSKPAPRSLIDGLTSDVIDDINGTGSLAWVALVRLVDIKGLFVVRQFWRRCWILQELVFAKDVLFLCGKNAFIYDDISEIASAFVAFPDGAYPSTVVEFHWDICKDLLMTTLAMPLRSLMFRKTLDTALSSKQPYSQAWKILVGTCDLAASDPRDKIYSLLGLLNIGIEADYSKPVQAVYLELAQILFPQVPMEEWFDRAIHINMRMPTLPTWAVDWDSRSKGNSWSTSLSGKPYNAGTTMHNQLHQAEINGSSLNLAGTIFDEVHVLAPYFEDSRRNEVNGLQFHAEDSFRFDITGGKSEGEILYDSIPPGIRRGQASLRLFLDDMEVKSEQRCLASSIYIDLSVPFYELVTQEWWDMPGKSDNAINNFHELFLDESTRRKAKDREFAEVLEKENKLSKMQPEKQHELVNRVQEHSDRTRHFYTRKGYLGYGPKWIQEGDLVCVLHNCRVPVLLRKVDDHYYFVSLCFVLGIMDGEAAEMVHRGEIFMQKFDIR
jgi:hypothetical protein